MKGRSYDKKIGQNISLVNLSFPRVSIENDEYSGQTPEEMAHFVLMLRSGGLPHSVLLRPAYLILFPLLYELLFQ